MKDYTMLVELEFRLGDDEPAADVVRDILSELSSSRLKHYHLLTETLKESTP